MNWQAIAWGAGAVVGALNTWLMLNIRLAVSELKTEISEARREDADGLKQWAEEHFERKAAGRSRG